MGAILIKAAAFTLYPVRGMNRARAFYEEALGLPLAKREVRDLKSVEYDLEGNMFPLTNLAKAGIPGTDRRGGFACEMKNLDEAGRRHRAK
jgi:catechol 2,3-dioxygenase-like lactoylglutathione lyase family enzyme